MRKGMAALMILALAVCLAAAASAEEGEKFLFRGFPWGSSPEEILAAEKTGPVRHANGLAYVSAGDARISRFSGTATWIFREDRLVLAGYSLQEDLSREMLEELEEALGTVYGAAEPETDAAWIHAVCERIHPGFLTEEEIRSCPSAAWKAAGNTRLALLWLQSGDPEILILYVSPLFLEENAAAPAGVDTTGL